MQKTTPPGQWIENLPLQRTLLAIHKKSQDLSFCKKINLFVLLAYATLAASATLLQQLLACCNVTLDSEDLFCWYFCMNYGSSTSSWKPWRWVRFDLILTMRDIYINSNLNPLTKFTSSSRNTKLKDIFLWNISQMITKTILVSTRIVISYMMKWGILFWVWWKVNVNWDNIIRISQWRESKY